MGPETKKFIELYGDQPPHMLGNGIDIGYGGKLKKPIYNYFGYDRDSKEFDPSGKMPFADEAFDVVYSSHCLEHIVDYQTSLREWFRILKTGGHMVLLLPHKFLYEKKEHLPGRFNTDHKRFYTPASLLKEVEDSLAPNSYRVRVCEDIDEDFDYAIPPEQHSKGNYSVHLVLEKIVPPMWGF